MTLRVLRFIMARATEEAKTMPLRNLYGELRQVQHQIWIAQSMRLFTLSARAELEARD